MKRIMHGTSYHPRRQTRARCSKVLQESLGGNAKTSLIITCSPSYFNEQDMQGESRVLLSGAFGCRSMACQETVSTLRFGQRVRHIEPEQKSQIRSAPQNPGQNDQERCESEP